MKILSTSQIREWDQYTIQHEPVASVALMERAGSRCAQRLLSKFGPCKYFILCGTGNNGGDGLVIARYLRAAHAAVQVVVAGNTESGSVDFKQNLERWLSECNEQVNTWNGGDELPQSATGTIWVDALFGTGLNRPLEGEAAEVIAKFNQLPLQRVAIDVPSGMIADLCGPQPGVVAQCHSTLTLQVPKAAFFFEENYPLVGEWQVVDIGLHPDFITQIDSATQWLTDADARQIIRERPRFLNKYGAGSFQLIGGSYGKMGAAVLASRAALRTGCGLVTAHIPRSGYTIMQTALPEAMCHADEGEHYLTDMPVMPKAAAVAVGPGMGTEPETSLAFRKFLSSVQVPVVLDADALNLLATRQLGEHIPRQAVLTPHTGEFERLFGHFANSFDRIAYMQRHTQEHPACVVLKGAYTAVAFGGVVNFNTTGCTGMATAGSGDVLTGIIGSLLAQGYSPLDAARLGVFLHGRAGELAARDVGSTGLLASEIADCMPQAIDALLNFRD